MSTEIKTFQGDDFVNYETKYVYALFEYEPVIIFIHNYVPSISLKFITVPFIFGSDFDGLLKCHFKFKNNE